MYRRNASVDARSNSARTDGRVRSDLGGLGVASGTQLSMNVNEVISNGCDVQVPTQHLWGAQIESAGENCAVGMDRLGWGRTDTAPATENRSRS
jgi:hypothetical protein